MATRSVMPLPGCIDRERTALGLTVGELAVKAGVSPDTIKAAQSGKRILIGSMGLIAKAVGRSVSELCDEGKAATPAPPSGDNEVVAQRRKELAVRLSAEWGLMTDAHRLALEARWPGSIYRVREPVGRAEAEAIFESSAESADGEVRLHLIGVLNYLGTVASAYLHAAADRDILEEQFHGVMFRWRTMLAEFIELAWEKYAGERMRPWEPLVQMVDEVWRFKPGQGETDESPSPAA